MSVLQATAPGRAILIGAGLGGPAHTPLITATATAAGVTA